MSTDTLGDDVSPTPTGRNPWIPMSVIMGATIMVALDSTIVNVALHQIGLDLGAGDDIEWVVTAYLLAVCASQPATGWLSERFGRREIFLGSLAVFTVASALCGFAPNLNWLIAFRVLQGLGGGALIPIGMAMALGMFPRERHGRAVSVWGMSAMLAPAIGPTVGGWLVTAVSWHWLFLINVPIGACAFVAGIKLLPTIGHRGRRPFDGLGLVLGSGGLTIAVLGISEGSSWGWTSTSTLVCILGGAAMLALFVVHELRTDHPLIELRMFSDRTFSLAITAFVFVTGANFARLVFIPLQLESLRGLSAFRVGMMFFVPALFGMVGMSFGGRLVDHVGPRRPIVIGCAAMFVAMLSFSQLTLTTPLFVIVILMSIQGFGSGASMAPLMVAGLSDLPERLTSEGAAVRSLSGQIASAMAVAVLGAVVSSNMGSDPTVQQSQDAFNSAFTWAAVGVLIALLVAIRLPKSAPQHIELESEALLALE